MLCKIGLYVGSVERCERGQRGQDQLRAAGPGEPGRPAHHAASPRQVHQRRGEISHTLLHTPITLAH